jgi:xanthine/uracil permease
MNASAPIRFNRQEWSGAFGDLGTDLPLLVGIILASGMDSASALTLFGVMQILTALRYRLPMPVQPLKAMAALIIAQKIPAETVYGGGLAIGILMMALTGAGLLDWVARVVPKVVIRGVQLGLGLSLARIALKDYVPAESTAGYLLAGAAFLLTIALMGRKRFPAGVIVVGMGLVYALATRLSIADLAGAAGFHLPSPHVPTPAEMWTGFLILALPQVPLSIANSVLATKQVAEDLFPERPLSIRGIGFTYSLMNLINPWLGGIPTCHGSGGMAGHYAFGGRTGGSVILYGLLFVILGLFFSGGFQTVIQIFPLPVLGVLLLFEALTLMVLVRDVAGERGPFVLVLLVGLAASLLPYGFLIAMVGGTLLHLAMGRGWLSFSPR